MGEGVWQEEGWQQRWFYLHKLFNGFDDGGVHILETYEVFPGLASVKTLPELNLRESLSDAPKRGFGRNDSL